MNPASLDCQQVCSTDESSASAGIAPNNDELIASARNGEQSAYDQLDRHYRGRVIAFIRSRGAGESDAEEVAQQALSQAFLQISELRNPSALESWLISIASRCHVDLLRRKRMQPIESNDSDVESEAPSPSESAAIRDECDNLLRVAKDILTHNRWQLIRLHYVEGKEIQEIARIMGKTKIWVRVNLFRSRAELVHAVARTEEQP